MSDTPNTSTAPSEDCGGEPCSTTLKKLYEFLDGELSSEQVRTIQRHLTACSECTDVKNFELAESSRGAQEPSAAGYARLLRAGAPLGTESPHSAFQLFL